MGAYSKGGGGGVGGLGRALFWHYEIGSRHFFGEGHLLERGRLVEKIRCSLFLTFFSEQTSSYLKYLMNSCILHSEPSILRLLNYILTLLIAKILHNYEFELEILILVVLSYCGVSNMVSRRPSFQFLFIQIFFCLITVNILKIIFVHCGEETYINDPRSYEHYCTSSWNKTWKKFRPIRDLNPWPLRHRCSALPTELTSQLGAGHYVGSK